MANTTARSSPPDPKPPLESTEISATVNSTVQVEMGGEAPADLTKKAEPSRPLMIYTRPQILFLHRSPLVKPPPDMPSLKDWFGVENEQSLSKKDSEPGSSRDRRFRRDAEDGENSSRSAFRSTMTQPSQMGNFKHQSMRTNDRERDKDVDKDREREMRDKEGQERLRNLSDKYDRDRLALPSVLTNLRNKDKDTAPHLAVGPSTRTSAQSQATTVASRRSDTRDAGKKKAGESSEDWRRGAEPPRSSRDERERPDNSRKDREDREAPRSHARESSRQRRDQSTSKRDRDREDRDRRERERDESRRERDDYRKEGDDHVRRDKESERGLELDDPRRWRDDGKRDERLAARRERERVRDRALHETGRDTQDRHWTVVEERDSRAKRTAGRDRRGGGGGVEDGKDKDDKREREKEKEPAWMETYVSSDPPGGILGGKVPNGELDGIQAWKKGLKGKGQLEKPSAKDSSEAADVAPPSTQDASESHLDEIQLFRLMMKREEEKKRKGADDNRVHPTNPATSTAAYSIAASTPPSSTNASGQRKGALDSSGLHATDSSPHHQINSNEEASKPSVFAIPPSAPSIALPASNLETSTQSANTTRSLISLLASQESGGAPFNPTPSSVTPALDKSKPPASRLFPNPLSVESASASQTTATTSVSASTNFNPPSSSRLLAFGSRSSAVSTLPSAKSDTPLQTGTQAANGLHVNPSIQQNITHHVPHPGNGTLSLKPQTSDVSFNQGYPHAESARAQQGFSPFGDQSHPVSTFDELREPTHSTYSSDTLRRTSESSLYPDLVNTGSSSGFSVNQQNESTGHTGAGAYAASKGSRFAKFFDGKVRDGSAQVPSTAKAQTLVGVRTSSPISGHRQEGSGFNGVVGTNSENRAMDDIVAMLNNSAQAHRMNLVDHTNQGATTATVPFGQSHNSFHSLQQQHLQQHLTASNRLDDRNFVPDGMVPGLRSAPPPRGRDGSVYSDSIEDTMRFDPQRIHQQQRSLESMYTGTVYQPTGAGRNVGLPIQQQHFRNGPSPVTNQSAPQTFSQQRLPPGLANLGGRPPHESSQFLSMQGMPSNGLHNTFHGNGQPFNTFVSPSGGGGYSGGPQMRIPPATPHQLQTALALNQIAGMDGHSGNIDLRGPNHAHLLSMGGGVGGGLRGAAGFGPQPNGPAPMQAPHLAVRQQQHIPSHILPHLIPPHLQQQSLPNSNNQPAHDLMALLMGSSSRE